MLARLRALAASPRAPFAVVLVAVALLLPTLGAGLFADDITHELLLSPRFRLPGGPRGAWDLFRFVGPDRADFQRGLDGGFWPWWSAPDLRLGFFRPLSALWHALDYRVLGGVPWLLHAESLAVYVVVALAAATLYRRLVRPAWAATLAALVFAVDDAHSLTVVWVANRNALVAAAFGLAAVVAHDRARRDGDRACAVLAPVLFAIGLLGGEAAVAALAWVVAHAAFLDDAPPRRRAIAIAPWVAVLAAYTVVYKLLGYGAVGSGYYLDPSSEPLAFARAVLTRLPTLLLAELFLPPADVWQLVPPGRALPATLVASVVLVVLLAILARALRGDRVARFFAAGAVLSLVPVCATWPNDRLLLASSVGGAGLVALLVARVAEAGAAAPRSARALAWAFVVVHVVLAPPLLPLRALSFSDLLGRYVARAERTLLGLVPAPEGRVVVVVNAPDMLVTNYAVGRHLVRGGPPASSMHLLATAIDGNDGAIERTDERTLVVSLARGFADDPFGKVVRGAGARSAPGEVRACGPLRVEVLEVTDDGRPRRAAFRMDRPLEDPSIVWVTWAGEGYAPFTPPRVGDRAKLPAIDLLAAMGAGA